MISEKDGVVSFNLFRIERGREKICKCNPPHYIIDEENRLVTCADCGATLDGFEALLRISDYMKQYEEYQERALEKIKAYSAMADKEFHRRMKNAIFKDMDKQYQSGLYPYCPKCGEMINPIEIKEWGNEKYYERKSK